MDIPIPSLEVMRMKIGEVCLLTNHVVRLANFYKAILNIENNSDDTVHQTLIAEETQFTIYNDGSAKENINMFLHMEYRLLATNMAGF